LPITKRLTKTTPSPRQFETKRAARCSAQKISLDFSKTLTHGNIAAM
jgi:hypothetical protein